MIKQENHQVYYQARCSHYHLINDAEMEWTREDPHLRIYCQTQNFPILITNGKVIWAACSPVRKPRQPGDLHLREGRIRAGTGHSFPAEPPTPATTHLLTGLRGPMTRLFPQMLLLALSLAKCLLPLLLSKGEGGQGKLRHCSFSERINFRAGVKGKSGKFSRAQDKKHYSWWRFFPALRYPVVRRKAMVRRQPTVLRHNVWLFAQISTLTSP